MKHIYLVLLMLLLTGYGFGQTNTFPSSGNVGIGTNAPVSLLTIRGGGTGLSFHPGTAPYYGTLAFNRESATGAIFDPTGFAFQINNGGSDTNLHFQVWNGTGALVSNEALVIGSNGNVGVGVSNTQGYKLAVAGSMIAESVKVKLQGAWPDYVFVKGYTLPSLQSTDQYIKDKGHLPGIPSAAEVKSNGVDLGEMNAKLLEKIEELTLHLIQMEKKNDLREKANALLTSKLQAEIEALKTNNR